MKSSIKLVTPNTTATAAPVIPEAVLSFAAFASQAFVTSDRLGDLVSILNDLAAKLKADGIELGNTGVCPYASTIRDVMSQAYATENRSRAEQKLPLIKFNAAKLANNLSCMRYAVKAGYWLGFNPADAKAYYEKALDTPAANLTELKEKAGSTGRGKKETIAKTKTVNKRGIESVLKSLFAHNDVYRFQSQFTAKEWLKIIAVSRTLGLVDSDFKSDTQARVETTAVSAQKRAIKAK